MDFITMTSFGIDEMTNQMTLSQKIITFVILLTCVLLSKIADNDTTEEENMND